MKIFTIEYHCRKSDRFMCSMRVRAVSSEMAIKKAMTIKKVGLQDYSITEFAHPFKLGNRYYSPKLGTYNAVWLTQEGKTAYWGSYCPRDGSYCLYYGNIRLASGTWDADRFETFGDYNYDDVRKAIQFGLA